VATLSASGETPAAFILWPRNSILLWPRTHFSLLMTKPLSCRTSLRWPPWPLAGHQDKRRSMADKKNPVHKPLEGHSCIFKTEGHLQEFKKSKRRDHGRLGHIAGGHLHLVISVLWIQINLMRIRIRPLKKRAMWQDAVGGSSIYQKLFGGVVIDSKKEPAAVGRVHAGTVNGVDPVPAG
jgi:hypothetical protein